MAQDDAQPARPDAQAAPPPPAHPPVRTSRTRGFVGGLVGGVVGALGSVYALQYPEVRENLPLPEQAALIVNPEAVARISALEEELAQVRNFARESDNRQELQTLAARVDTLSSEVTQSATTAQLADLRDGLSPLATPDGAAELEQRLADLRADLGDLSTTAARASSLATVEAAVQGFERRVASLETDTPALRTDLDRLAADLETARTNVREIAATLARVETGLAERTAALGGRIDATARDVADVREAIGAAGTRIDGLGDEVAELADATATTADLARAADTEAEATATAMDELAASTEERLAAIADEAAAASTAADEARTTVTRAIAGARAGGRIGTAARTVGDALANGSDLSPAVAALDAVDSDVLDATQGERLDEAREVLAEHSDGVASLPALRMSFANLRPAVERAIAPPPAEGVGNTLLGTLQMRPRSPLGEAAATLDRITDRLDGDDVAGAIASAETLPEAAQDALADWLASARAHVAVDAARADLLDLGRDVTATAAGAS
ncbi:MAG: hypothetical protein ACOC3D_03155 [Pseudomonadota bacterium]